MLHGEQINDAVIFLLRLSCGGGTVPSSAITQKPCFLIPSLATFSFCLRAFIFVCTRVASGLFSCARAF